VPFKGTGTDNSERKQHKLADIQIIGNLGSDSELTYGASGKAKLEFSVGDTPRRLNPQTQQWEDAGETTWWRVTEWERKAEFWAEHLLKGTKVLVIGTAGVRTYEKKDGSKGFSAEVKPKHIAIVPKQGGQQARPQQDTWAAPQANQAPANPQWAQTEPPF
jgi:single-strand DNA-binding protein